MRDQRTYQERIPTVEAVRVIPQNIEELVQFVGDKSSVSVDYSDLFNPKFTFTGEFEAVLDIHYYLVETRDEYGRKLKFMSVRDFGQVYEPLPEKCSCSCKER